MKEQNNKASCEILCVRESFGNRPTKDKDRLCNSVQQIEPIKMDKSKEEVLQYFKRRVLEAGEPVTFNQLSSFLCKPFTKEMKKTLLGSHRNCLVGELKIEMGL